jgi:hypothetical protein
LINLWERILTMKIMKTMKVDESKTLMDAFFMPFMCFKVLIKCQKMLECKP